MKTIGDGVGGESTPLWRGYAGLAYSGGGLSPWFMVVLTLFAIGYNVYFLLLGIGNPVLEQFGFRQTQTAISTFWMLHEGTYFAYQTPVLGAPWQIPFEFPTYQMIVALVVKGLGWSLDSSGRMVSQAFFLATVFPLYSSLRSLGIPVEGRWMAVVLFLLAPLNVFWGRAFMIESAALFFALSWLALLLIYVRNRRSGTLLLALLFGVLGILTKATTFAVPGLLGGLIFLFPPGRQVVASADRARLIAVGCATCAVVVAVGIVWVMHTDAVKSLHPIGSYLTSGSLAAWNYGEPALRWSSLLWEDTIWRRSVPEIFGPLHVLPIACLAAATFFRTTMTHAFLAIAAALAPMLIYTNLHVVHNYYQYANATFLIMGVAAVLGALADKGWRLLARFAFAATVISQVAGFEMMHRPLISADLSRRITYNLGAALKAVTGEGEAILVFGVDWSSEVPYYAERKALAVPAWATDGNIAAILDDPGASLGGLRLGAIASCGLESYGARASLIESFLLRHAEIGRVGPCVIYRPMSSGRELPASHS